MTVKPVPARAPYSPPQFGTGFNRDEMRTAFGALARSVAPQVTRSVTADTTALVSDDLIVCDTTAGNISVTLPAAAQVQFLRVGIINIGAGTVTVVGTVSGGANPTLAQWKSTIVQTDGVRWMKIGGVV